MTAHSCDKRLRAPAVVLLAALAAVLLLFAAPSPAQAQFGIGAVSGTVSSPVGPLEGVSVTARPHGGGQIVGTTTTGPDGTYTLAPLDPGDYAIHFAADDYVSEFYDDAIDLADAAVVTVPLFGTQEGIDATLAPDATVSGTVTDTSLNPAAGICVSAAPQGSGVTPAPVVTDENGRYTVVGIGSGTYTIQFDSCDSANNLVTEWYDNQPTPATADTITITTGETLTGIDAILAAGGSISGTLLRANGQPADGAEVKVRSMSGTLLESRPTNLDGTYTVDQLATGSYKVEFLPPADSFDSPEFYDDQASVATATPVDVTMGSNTPGIDAQLAGDTLAPEVTIDGGPDGLTNDPTPTFDYSTEDGATLECSIDTGTASWGPCTDAPDSHTPASPLSDGDYTFRVRATDPSMNVGTPATRDFTVDATPPDVSVTSGPEGLTGETSPSFGFSAEDGATLECAVDPAPVANPTYGPCTGADTHDAGTLADGDYTFTVRATDAAGNENAAGRDFTVDGSAPTVSITGGPSGPTNNVTPSFTFTADAGVTLQCAVDPAGAGSPSYGPCTSGTGHTAATLAEGNYTFTVKASDGAGNFTTDTRNFTVDTSAPGVQVTGGPNGPTGDTTPTFTFTADSGTTLECSIDSGTPSYGPCSGASSHTPSSALADGPYTFRIRATDSAGNFAVDTRSFTVDSTAPLVQITGGPSGTTTQKTPTFTFSADPGTTLACSIDSGSPNYGPCSSPGSHMPSSPLADGSYTFRVRATDGVGNSASDTRSFTVTTPPPPPPPDTTAPQVTITGGPSGATKDTTPTFSFTSDDPGASFQCKVDGGAYSACNSPKTLSKLKKGSHTFAVTATDAAGNVSSAATRSFKVKKKKKKKR